MHELLVYSLQFARFTLLSTHTLTLNNDDKLKLNIEIIFVLKFHLKYLCQPFH